MTNKSIENKTAEQKKAQTNEQTTRELTDEEKKCLAQHQERSKKKPLKFKVTNNESGKPSVELKYDREKHIAVAKLTEALGTSDSDLQDLLLNQVMKTFVGCIKDNELDYKILTQSVNYSLAILQGTKPQDEIEALLAVQMIGVHNVAMETLAKAMLDGKSDKGKELNVNQSTKMLRTFIAQMEALKKYRTGGQQKMVVEHVHVNEGGQAIVGTVNQGGDKNKSTE